MSRPTGSKLIEQRLREIEQLRRKNRPGDARILCESTLEQFPANPQLIFVLGACALEDGNPEYAAGCFSQAAELQPQNAHFHAELGRSLLIKEMDGPATASFERALELDPRNCTALTGLATCLCLKMDFDRALELLSEALTLQPSSMEVNGQLMWAYEQIGNQELAIKHGKKAVKASGESAEMLAALGDVYLTFGETEQAINHYQRAIKKDPTNSRALLSLTEIRKVTGQDDPLIRQMEQALTRSMKTRQRQFMHFALGKAYDGCGLWDQAFEHFTKANRLEHSKYRPETVSKHIKRLINAFGAKNLAAIPQCADARPVPVFIVGMPRSGSTLIDQILCSHSAVQSLGESPEIGLLTELMSKELGSPYPACMASVTHEQLQGYASRYLEHASNRLGAPTVVIDKNPFNFYFLGLISILFPNAKLIHSIRNPMDTCLSCYFTGFSETGPKWAHDLELTGNFYRQYRNLMQNWQTVLPQAILDVHYEDVINDTEASARRIVNFCGLDWEPGCLAFYRNRRAVKTASTLQVRRPIYQTSVGRWAPYAPHLQPLVDALGDTLADQQDQILEAGLKYRARGSLLARLGLG